MTFITAASVEDLVRQVAETAMRLGRMGAVLDAIEVRLCEEQYPDFQIDILLEEPVPVMRTYERYECQLHHHWAALDEATHRPARQQEVSRETHG